MKKSIHPKMNNIEVTCVTCEKKHKIMSTSSDIKVDVCNNCHPIYTGNTTTNSKAGRVDRFNKRLNKKTK